MESAIKITTKRVTPVQVQISILKISALTILKIYLILQFLLAHLAHQVLQILQIRQDQLEPTNPFAVDIDLSKSESIKLFKTATEGLPKEKQYDGNKENGRAFKSAAQDACNDFCWGEICTSIQATINGANENLNIFDDYHKLSLDDVVSSAKAIWTGRADTHAINTQTTDAATIQRRIWSLMMAKWIKKSLSDDGMLTLKVHKDAYEFKNSKGAIECDGPVMLRVFLEDIELAVRVGA